MNPAITKMIPAIINLTFSLSRAVSGSMIVDVGVVIGVFVITILTVVVGPIVVLTVGRIPPQFPSIKSWFEEVTPKPSELQNPCPEFVVAIGHLTQKRPASALQSSLPLSLFVVRHGWFIGN